MDFKDFLVNLDESIISSFDWNPPQDPRKLLYDFYFLVGYATEIQTISRAREEEIENINLVVEKCVNYLTSHMTSVLKYVLGADLHHYYNFQHVGGRKKQVSKEVGKFLYKWEYYFRGIDDSDWGEFSEEPSLEDGAKKNPLYTNELKGKDYDNREYAASYSAAQRAQDSLNLTDVELAAIYKEFYPLADFSDGNKKPWIDIANTYYNILNAKSIGDKIVLVDHVYDLQHHNGTIFMKLNMYSKKSRSDNFEWISQALDTKRDIRDIYEYYNLVSAQLRPLLTWIAAHKYAVYKDKKPRIPLKNSANRKIFAEEGDKVKIYLPWYIRKNVPKYYEAIRITSDHVDFFEKFEDKYVTVSDVEKIEGIKIYHFEEDLLDLSWPEDVIKDIK